MARAGARKRVQWGICVRARKRSNQTLFSIVRVETARLLVVLANLGFASGQSNKPVTMGREVWNPMGLWGGFNGSGHSTMRSKSLRDARRAGPAWSHTLWVANGIVCHECSRCIAH